MGEREVAKGQIKARVQCTIDVPVGVWAGGQTDMDALAEQVRREGANIVIRAMKAVSGVIIGEPKVVFIVFSEGQECQKAT